eukprot:CAMPEP_0181113286 /NCGR_PEP_ID=MMETSP1071-20121207/20267_1 /TAXON_ID=35127 /ORGANISM="Thalassiosira sp., Strain NH16" /LENGTH=76 /DNA_ID=CAMNT_0023197315 /DNA_START=298 /DNA_END=528 /DNA_ORIENTATION=-
MDTPVGIGTCRMSRSEDCGEYNGEHFRFGKGVRCLTSHYDRGWGGGERALDGGGFWKCGKGRGSGAAGFGSDVGSY